MITTTYPITPRQQEVLDYIVQCCREDRRPPTFRQIMDNFGMKSPNGVTCNLKALVKKGYLAHYGDGKSRAYVPAAREDRCPCCGRGGEA